MERLLEDYLNSDRQEDVTVTSYITEGSTCRIKFKWYGSTETTTVDMWDVLAFTYKQIKK